MQRCMEIVGIWRDIYTCVEKFLRKKTMIFTEGEWCFSNFVLTFFCSFLVFLGKIFFLIILLYHTQKVKTYSIKRIVALHQRVENNTVENEVLSFHFH